VTSMKTRAATYHMPTPVHLKKITLPAAQTLLMRVLLLGHSYVGGETIVCLFGSCLSRKYTDGNM